MKSVSYWTVLSIQLLFAAVAPVAATARLSEPERVAQWYKKHKWPPVWQPETEPFRNLMEFREREIMNLTGADERWENWNQYVQGRLVPTFTTNGFEVATMPPHIFQKLKQAVDAGIANWDNLRSEGNIDVIYNSKGLLPKFIDMQTVVNEVMHEILPLHEKWAGGIKLKATSAYGVRLYQNGSSLVMHNDKIQTHVISSITHIAHLYDNDSEPWPIQIENHRTGEVVSVTLEPGQMLFYESAKCLHGRMTELKGRYYGSVFIHYQPVDPAVWNYDVESVIEAIPPHWRDGVTQDHGDTWAGCAITTPSRRAEGALKRQEKRTLYHNEY